MTELVIHFRGARVLEGDGHEWSRCVLYGDARLGSSLHSFGTPLVPFLVELLNAVKFFGRREEFDLVLADDGEVALHATPEEVGTGTWQICVNLGDTTVRVGPDRLLLTLLMAFSDLRTVCAEAGIAIESVAPAVPAEISWST